MAMKLQRLEKLHSYDSPSSWIVRVAHIRLVPLDCLALAVRNVEETIVR